MCEIYALILESFRKFRVHSRKLRVIRENVALIRESYALVRKKCIFFLYKMSPIGFRALTDINPHIFKKNFTFYVYHSLATSNHISEFNPIFWLI